MTVKSNMAAQATLNELNRNNSKLSKSLRQISSGMKINSAQDDASGFSISEKMRVQIRSLAQDVQNVKTGKSMLQVASGGIENIIEELRNVKELALNAANDHNSYLDRSVLQKEFEQKLANINDIASTTNYNGKYLLDGRYGLRKVGETSQPPRPTGNATLITAAGVSPAAVATYAITTSGVYQLGTSCANCRILVNAPNVELRGSGGQNLNVYVECMGTNTSLWLNNYDISLNRGAVGDVAAVRFSYGSGNTLNLVGNSLLELTSGTKATINVGGGLTIYGDGALTATRTNGFTGGALIGSDANETSNANITINSGTLTLESNQLGAAIGCGDNGSIGNITINGGRIRTVSGSHAAGIGVGRGNGSVGNITINGGDIRACSYGGSGNAGSTGIGGSAASGSSVGNITLRGGKVYAENSSTTTGLPQFYGGNTAPAIGPGGGICGTVTAPGTFYNSNHQYEQDLPDVPPEDDGVWEGTPLVIHHGTKAGQAVNVFINNMHTDAMGLNDSKVTTRDFAVASISKIDDAIDYALDEATTVGSYISRLDCTEENLVTADENTQSSESTIRDADMAKSMTEYTKNSILSQAAQSMLAQANQNAGSVLSLLQ